MTSPAPLLPPLDARRTLPERLGDRLSATPALSRAMHWVVPALITLLAGILRIAGLSHPHQVMFDETYYVKDAWALWNLGYEAKWDDGADELLPRGDTSAMHTEGSFIVHPPLGKWLITWGMAASGGPGSSFGWRISVAVLGTLTVLLVHLVALELTRSQAVASIASGLLAIDGVAIAISRIALLDGILTFFLLLGFLFVLYDRRHALESIAVGVRDAEHRLDGQAPLIGPVLWNRPWLMAAGLTLGAASAVKWSGLYALAVLGLYVVITDALARRRAGVALWHADAVSRQGPASFVLLVLPALAVYLASWSGWLATAGGYDRHSDPNPLVALWNYHSAMLGFHVGLESGHPYASAAWQWPLMLRPTAIWVDDAPTGCGSDHCIAVMSAIPNALIWMGGVIAALVMLWVLIRALRRRTAPVPAVTYPLVGLLATYVPWLMFPERTIFQFYTVAMTPFLCLSLAVGLGMLAGRRTDPLHRRQAGQRTVVVFLVAAVLVSAFFYPLWTGMSVPYNFWLLHNWLPGWV